MKRYIDVDEFKLPCTSEDCHECIFFSLNRCIMKEHINNNTITADMVEVVRCKDCKHQDYCYKTVSYTKVRLGYNEHGAKPIEWCSNGERRE